MASAAAFSPMGGGRHGRWPAGLYLALLTVVLALVTFLTMREARTATPADTEAEAIRYVRLALALDRLREGEVDSWFGPAALNRPEPDDPVDLGQLDRAVGDLADDLTIPGEDHDELHRASLRTLVHGLSEVTAIMIERGERHFYQEASRLYGIAPPTDVEAVRWRRARAELEVLLPGEAPLAARVKAFRGRFVVPVDRQQAIFERALAECRKRTLARWKLPSGERLDIIWTDAVPAAWHRYKGAFRSVLQINRQALALPGQAIDLACHEGYPGHHAQFVVADAAAAPDGLPIEERLTLLRSPGNMIREGAADAGVELAFPEEERFAFLRGVLFPLAGFDPADAERYVQFEALERVASGASLPILARYRDGVLDRDRAADALAEEALVASPGALLDFTDRYGAYVASYTLARDRVRAALDSSCGNPWTALRALVERPHAAFLYRQAAASAIASS